MNKYISIFPNTDSTINSNICIGAGNIQAESKEDAIRQTIYCIPYSWPFYVYEQNDYDKTFHNAYEPDWNNPDGYGLNTNMRTNFLTMGYTENW
jgi:hypothetical protein